MNDTELMILMVQQVITVMGARTSVDVGAKLVPKTANNEMFEPEPFDSPDDLPPGKEGSNDVSVPRSVLQKDDEKL